MSTPINTESPIDLDAIGSGHVMNYVECDLAGEVTLPVWRRARAAAEPHRRHSFRFRFGTARRRASQ